jgi:hypothetical protein
LISSSGTITGGRLSGIQASLLILGESDDDTVVASAEGETLDLVGTISAGKLSGFGMGAQAEVLLQGAESLSMTLGAGNDTVSLTQIQSGMSIDVSGNTGNDQFDIRGMQSPVTILGQGGSDKVLAWLRTSSRPDGNNLIRGLLTVQGGADGVDELLVRTLSPDGDVGELTDQQITGLGTTDGIRYNELEQIGVELGTGNDQFTVRSTHSGLTTVNLGKGNNSASVLATSGDTSVVADSGDDTFRIGSESDSQPGELNAISGGLLTVTAGLGQNVLSIDDRRNSQASIGSLSATRVQGFGMQEGIQYEGFSDVRLETGSGDDSIQVLGTHLGNTELATDGGDDRVDIRAITGSLNVQMGSGNDTVHVGSLSPASGGIIGNIQGALSVVGDVGSDVLAIDDSGETQSQQGTLSSNRIEGLGLPQPMSYEGMESLRLELGSGSDGLEVNSTHSGATEIATGSGADQVLMRSTAGTVMVNTGTENDQINVRSMGGDVTVDAGDGTDTIRVGSLASNVDGTVEGIAGKLIVAGGPGSDMLLVDDSGDTQSQSLTLTSQTLTGLGMSNPLEYGGIETLEVLLGHGEDTVTIESTHTGQTLVSLGAGNNTSKVLSTSGGTTLIGGSGDDTVRVGSESGSQPGRLNGIAGGLLSVIGGAGQNTLFVDDRANNQASSGTLNTTTVQGFGMPMGVRYEDISKLELDLGSGDDTLQVLGTQVGLTQIKTNDGTDRVQVQAISGSVNVHLGIGDDNVHVGSNAPTTGGVLRNIQGALTIEGNGGADTLFVDDGSEAQSQQGTLSSNRIEGLGLPQAMIYEGMESLRLELGSGSDGLEVSSTHSGVTEIATGSGADQVLIRSTAGTVAVNTGTENDQINIRTIGGDVTIDAGDGTDTIHVGSLAANVGGTVEEIAGKLNVEGGIGSDILLVDDSGDAQSQNLTVTSQMLMGLGMPKALEFSGMETVEVLLGQGEDAITVDGTHAGMTRLVNSGGADTLKLNSHDGEVSFIGSGANDTLLLDSSYMTLATNDPKITFTTLENGRQRAGFWQFNSTQGLVRFESVERFNYLKKLVLPVGQPGTASVGMQVNAPAIDDLYTELVTNFTRSVIQPIQFDSRAFNSPIYFGGTWDTDRDGFLSPLDALIVINHINRSISSGGVPYDPLFDVDRDNTISPLDILAVINLLNQPATTLTFAGSLQFSRADLNNDGLEEIQITGTVQGRPALAILNGVTGALNSPPQYLSSSANPFGTYIAFGDIDGDGINEMIVSSDRGSPTYGIWKLSPSGYALFSERTMEVYPGYIGGVRVAAGDVNGDGRAEIIVGTGSGADAMLKAYDQDGRLVTTYVIPSSFGRGGILPRVGDYNGDGLMDVFVASGRRGDSQVAVFTGNSMLGAATQASHEITGTFSDSSSIAPIDLALADSDGDDMDELYVWQGIDGRNPEVRKWKYDKAVDEFFREF